MNPGTLIGKKYRLTRQIGEGAMGTVWAAVNEDTSGEVALKLILHSNEELRFRLRREARAAGKLRHPNVLEIYDMGETVEGDPFLVMPLLSGETLRELLERQRRVDPPLAARIARDVARALAAAHAGQIIHRDLKPANIFLHQEPHANAPIVKVLDFGVSKNLSATDGLHTVAGGAIGSPAYMSPEQARADRTLDQRADIWSLGVVLFEMLTGVRPFKGDANQLIPQIVAGEIPLVSRFVRHVDPALAGLVARCIERDRDKRVRTATDLANELERFVVAGATLSPAAPHAPHAPLGSRPDALDPALRSPRLPLGDLDATARLSRPGAPGAAPAPLRAPFSSQPDPLDPATRSPRLDGMAPASRPSLLAEDAESFAATTRIGPRAMGAMLGPRPPAPSASWVEGMPSSQPRMAATAPPSAPGQNGAATAPPSGTAESGNWPVTKFGTMMMPPDTSSKLANSPMVGGSLSPTALTTPLPKTPTDNPVLSSEAATLQAMNARRKIGVVLISGLGVGMVGLLGATVHSVLVPSTGAEAALRPGVEAVVTSTPPAPAVTVNAVAQATNPAKAVVPEATAKPAEPGNAEIQKKPVPTPVAPPSSAAPSSLPRSTLPAPPRPTSAPQTPKPQGGGGKVPGKLPPWLKSAM